MAELDDIQLCNVVATLVKDAQDYRDERAEERLKAMAFFEGDAKELEKHIPTEEKRSKLVSRDVRAAIKKVLPSIYRTILGNDEIVEFQPLGEGDEETAKQATDYLNYVILPECDGRQAIEDAINDAVRLRNGIIKWWQEETVDVRYSNHNGLDEYALAMLVEGDDVEVIAHTERMEMIETPEGPVEVPAHDVRIKRTIRTSRPRIAAVPLENWLIHPDAIRLEDSPIIGEVCNLRRSDLVRMGYDRDTIWAIPAAGQDSDREEEEDARRRDVEDDKDAPQKALDEIEYYDLLVRVDKDGDGIAELRRMIFAGGIDAKYLLKDEEWDEIHYADIVSERRPHQWEGNSVADDLIDLQTANTVLLRQTADNLYWQNNPQPVVLEGVIENMDAVNNPSFGEPIRIQRGNVQDAIQWNIVPMVADKSFAMIDYLKREAVDRTGISDASSGLAPDALQNMTAKATALIEQAGIGQVEMMVRCIANSLKPVFRGLLKLIIQHQDKPRTVRLRDEWVTFDPRTWNADMDAVVNVGLGAGTRERDMAAMMQVIGLQKEILASMGPVVGMQYVTPQNLYNAISKLVQAAGLKTVGLYFTEPDPQQIQQAIAQMAQQPSPEEIKAQTQLAIEDKKTEREVIKTQVQTEARREEAHLKAQVDANREREQLAADMQTRMADLEKEAVIEHQRIEAETDNNEADRQLERERMALEYRMHQEDLASDQYVAAQKTRADMQRAQMSEAGKAMDRQALANQTQGRR